MKNLFVLVMLFSSSLVYSQSGAFTFSSGTDNGATVTSETVSTVTVTVSNSNGDVNLSDWTSFGVTGTNGLVAACNSNNTSMTLTFSATVNITTIGCADNVDFDTDTWTFTPNVGSPVNRVIDGNAGTLATLNFVGITSIVITVNGGGTDAFAVDNITMDATLPVELTTFTAHPAKNTVQLKWATATEVNNYGFEVERSAVGNQQSGWEKIAFVNGHGNSNSPKEYSFVDLSPLPGLSSYRLKQIDFDGANEYYDAVTVSLSASSQPELMQNNPNPFNPSTAIKFYIPENNIVSIKIYDMLGREITTLVNKSTDAGYHIIYWNGKDDAGKEVSSGVYLYKLTAGNFSETKKMNLLK